jgi:hypothetical protein
MTISVSDGLLMSSDRAIGGPQHENWLACFLRKGSERVVVLEKAQAIRISCCERLLVSRII